MTGLGGLIPSKNDVKGAEGSSCPGEWHFPLQTTRCNLLAELPGEKSLLKFTFLPHDLPEFMRLRRRKKRNILILKKLQIGEVLKMERLKKIQEEKLNKEVLGIGVKYMLPDGRAAL